MSSYDTRRTADYSPYVVHFTKDKAFVRNDLVSTDDPLNGVRHSTAQERLLSILTGKSIEPSPMPFLPHNSRAVCFTECIWDALVQLSEQYSPFGLVFQKRLVFERGGGPALYVRGDKFNQMLGAGSVPSELEPFISPFDPTEVIKRGVRLDFIHEREWRLPSKLAFEYSDVEYVIVPTLETANSLVRRIGSVSLPEEKFIPMTVYNHIRTAWGGT